MKFLAATAITLMMSAAIGTAAAGPYNHADDRQGAGRAWEHGDGGHGRDRDGDHRWNGDRDHDGDRRWNGDHGYRGNGYGWNRYGYGWNRAGYGWNRYSYGWYHGYRYQPRYVNVVVGDVGVPYYYEPAYSGPAYGYAYNAPYAYGNGNGYAACAPGTAYTVPVHRDNSGAKLFGALVGGALGHTVGKGDGRTAATVAGAAIGYGVAASATRDRGYQTVCGG